MASILSTNVTAVGSFTVTAPITSPSVQVQVPDPVYLAYELLLTVPNTGAISVISEYSSDSGASWKLLSADGVTGRVPKAGGSSNVRVFARVALTSTGLVQARVRVPAVSGRWPLVATVGVQ